MKTPEEIKNGLECCADLQGYDADCLNCPYNGEQWCGDKSKTDALAYIQQLEAKVPKWISVEERLPDDDANVLVHAIYKNKESVIVMTSYTHRMYGYNIEGWRSPWQYFFYDHEITHWMPLPEQPEEHGGAEDA